MKSKHGHKVYQCLTKVDVQLTWESKTACNAAHHETAKAIEVVIGRAWNLESVVSDVVKRFVIEADNLVNMFNQVILSQNTVVRLHNSNM